ncbi:ribosome assembly factor SBDS [Candidatus Woesearchaeota archaeon]|nr:ribosome assembly factor SBDS [Candidatus Woesearchaeota archaeon]
MSDHIHLARLKKGKELFEIVIDADKAVQFIEGKEVSIEDVVQSQHIYQDAKKGLEAAHEHLKPIFGTDDAIEIARLILKEGEIQFTSEYREALRKKKVDKIIGIIHRNGVDPKTNLPHPMERLHSALEHAKVHIDERVAAEQQVHDVVKKINNILPLKFVTKELEVIIPSAYAHKTYGRMKGFGKMKSDNWHNDSSWSGIIEIPGGMETDFYELVNGLCQGNATINVIKVK